jgi:hypothetical protein
MGSWNESASVFPSCGDDASPASQDASEAGVDGATSPEASTPSDAGSGNDSATAPDASVTPSWLNLIDLDWGYCGHGSFKTGSDANATISAQPWFLIYPSDGGLASYDISIDGVFIGHFSGDGYAKTCIQPPSALADGMHVITGVETAPHAGYVVRSSAFYVDTVPPPAPSTPILATYSDSDTPGDNTTRYTNPHFVGTATPGTSVRIYEGVLSRGGTVTDSTGRYDSATLLSTLGTHTLFARAVDRAGNQSAPSGPVTITLVAP